MAITHLQAEWENRIAAYRASGQTQSNWCRENDLILHK
ncbi:IS66 family insertion sequence element accessory protein TnpA [Neobacillus vireti]